MKPMMEPIPIILFCPKCGQQHIDAPEPERGWYNPPHRSHLCHFCNHIWRPADVPTMGVADIKTAGDQDFPIVRRLPSGGVANLVESFNREQSARIELVSEVERLKGTLQKAADKLCHYAADYPQPDTLRIINDCDRVLARGYYGVTEASTGDGPVVSDQRAEANARLRPPIAEGAWRHKKRGTTYRIEEPITIQCEAPVQDGEELLAYRAIRDGKLWGRRASEFLDGRFEPIVLIAKEAQPSAEATTNLVNKMVLRGAMQHCEAAATAIRALIDAPAPSADGEGE